MVFQALTDDKLHLNKQTGAVTILEHREGNRDFGTSLVRGFIEGFKDEEGNIIATPDIEITDEKLYSTNEDGEQEEFSLEDNAVAFPASIVSASDGTGTNSKIHILPSVKAKYFISENERKTAPSFIVLGHEMIHAKNNAFGRRIVGKGLPGHPAKNMEELNTQLEDMKLLRENRLKQRYVHFISLTIADDQ